MSPAAPAYERLPSPPLVDGASGFVQRARPLETSKAFLPHLLTAVTSLKVAKSSVNLALAESIVFLRPPQQQLVQATVFDEPERDTAAKEATGGTVRGLVNVVSLERCVVDDVRISLTGRQRVGFPSGHSEEFETLRQTLSLARSSGSKRVELERGVNSFEFSLALPATTMPTVRSSQFGRLRYTVKASIPGSGTLLKPSLTDERKVILVGIPEGYEEDARFEIVITSTQYWSGAHRLSITAERLVIGGSFALRLDLFSPPRNLTVFGLQLYINQTVVNRSKRGGALTRLCPKRILLRGGYLDGWAGADFPQQAKKNHLAELLYHGDSGHGLADDEGWSFSDSGTLPDDHFLKPTTLYHTGKTLGLIFKHELVLDVFFQQTGVEDERLMIATLCRSPITIASPYCSGQSLVLPEYSEMSD